MNHKLVQYVFWAWCILLSGCTVCQNARRTMSHEPRAFSWKHDRRRSVEAYRELADQLWQQEALACADAIAEPDYVTGFRDGFVDYVYAGGTGEPPPLPPRHFWNVAHRSPDGKERVHQWFDGYRHGAGVARDGGYRGLGVVHSSMFGLGVPPYAEFQPDAMSAIPTEPDTHWPNAEFDPYEEVLPAPEHAPALPPPNGPVERPVERPVDDSAESP